MSQVTLEVSNLLKSKQGNVYLSLYIYFIYILSAVSVYMAVDQRLSEH
jgi:hypothetical protein